MTSEMYQNGEYLEKNPDWHSSDSPFKAKDTVFLLKKHGIVPKTIAEVGCGAGEILKILSSEYKESKCEGYDISPQAINICKSKENSNLTYYCADILKQDKKFDVILCMDVFEHIEDYFGFLRKLRAKANYVIFRIPLDMNVQKVIRRGRLLKDRADVGHIHYFCKETALATLTDTGFDILEWFYTNNSIVPSGRQNSRLVRFFQRLFFRICPNFAVRLVGGCSLMVLCR